MGEPRSKRRAQCVNARNVPPPPAARGVRTARPLPPRDGSRAESARPARCSRASRRDSTIVHAASLDDTQQRVVVDAEVEVRANPPAVRLPAQSIGPANGPVRRARGPTWVVLPLLPKSAYAT